MGVGAHQSLEPLPQRPITNGRTTTWVDAQRQYADIAQRQRRRPALHACRSRSRYGYAGYVSPYSSSGSSGGGYGNSGDGGVRSSSSSRPHWSRAGSSISYTPAQVVSLTPIRQTVETRAAAQPDLRDVFLCHAWDDRQGPAKELLRCSWQLVSKFGSARRTLASAFR